MGLVESPNLKRLTRLNLEMRITTKYLDGKHSTFESLSEDDRLKLLLFDEIETKRENYLDRERREKLEAEKRAGERRVR